MRQLQRRLDEVQTLYCGLAIAAHHDNPSPCCDSPGAYLVLVSHEDLVGTTVAPHLLRHCKLAVKTR